MVFFLMLKQRLAYNNGNKPKSIIYILCESITIDGMWIQEVNLKKHLHLKTWKTLKKIIKMEIIYNHVKRVHGDCNCSGDIYHVGQIGLIESLDSCFFFNLKGLICVKDWRWWNQGCVGSPPDGGAGAFGRDWKRRPYSHDHW